jgi:hypothetical protein
MDHQASAAISVDTLARSVKDLQLYCESRIGGGTAASCHRKLLLLCHGVSTEVDELQLALLYHQEVAHILSSIHDDASACILDGIIACCRWIFTVLSEQVEIAMVEPTDKSIESAADVNASSYEFKLEEEASFMLSAASSLSPCFVGA